MIDTLTVNGVDLLGRAESHSATVNDCYPESSLKSDVRKELSTHHDRTESDNRVEVAYSGRYPFTNSGDIRSVRW
jgi:hypothetical protein